MGIPSDTPEYLLSPECYFDPAWYEREQQELFGRTYNLVGYESDLPNPGDYLAATIGNEPIVVIRGSDGELGAFSSVCRHRGIAITSESGHVDARLRCPYHGWEYGTDGALQRVPQRRAQFGELDYAELSLARMAIGSWAGMIFVNSAPDAPAFEEWLGEFALPKNSGDVPWDSLVDVARIRVPLRCNWKLFIENHIDNYHLWYLHESSLAMYDHRAMVCWKGGLHWASVEPLRLGGERIRRGLLPIPGLCAAERAQLRASLIFPNVPMTTAATAVMTYQVVPTGAESCVIDIRVRGAKESVLEHDDDVLTVLRDEDGRSCEQMQAAIRSRHFAVGPMAREHEQWIPRFQRDILSFTGNPMR